MYYPDLSPYQYSYKSQVYNFSMLNIGWLDQSKSYPTGKVSALFLDRLWVFCYNSVCHLLGYYDCPFCEKPSSNIRIHRGNISAFLGSGEIRVFGESGIIYAAPNLIYHYILQHNYLPPEEFIEAVLQSPLPGSAEYQARMSRLNQDWE